jgi:hypothetical protein
MTVGVVIAGVLVILLVAGVIYQPWRRSRVRAPTIVPVSAGARRRERHEQSHE